MNKVSYIKKIKNSRYRVFSESGKNMGTYDTMDDAKKRLRQIEFFKKKSFSKKLSALDKALRILDLKKQAIQLNTLGGKFIISFLATSFAFFALKDKSGDLKIEDIVYAEKTQNLLDEEPELYAEFITSEGMTIKSIVDTSFYFLDRDSRSLVQKYICDINSMQNCDDPLSEGESIIIPSTKAIESVGFKIKKKIDEISDTSEKKKNLKPLSVNSIPLEYIANIAEIESYSKFAYDDKNPSLLFGENKKAKGNWTIGFGHLLTRDEIISKKISINGIEYNWTDGLDKKIAQRLLRQDAGKNLPKIDYNAFDVNSDEMKAILSLSFLYGPSRVAKAFDSSIKNGKFDSFSFQKNIKSLPIGSLGGLPARRISEILTLSGIKLPATKKRLSESIKDYNDFVEGRYKGELVSPTSTSVDTLTNVISKFDSVSDDTTSGSSSNPRKMRELLFLVQDKKINNEQELIKLIKTLG